MLYAVLNKPKQNSRQGITLSENFLLEQLHRCSGFGPEHAPSPCYGSRCTWCLYNFREGAVAVIAESMAAIDLRVSARSVVSASQVVAERVGVSVVVQARRLDKGETECFVAGVHVPIG